MHVGRSLGTYAFGLHAVYVCSQVCDYNVHDDNDIMIVNMVSSTHLLGTEMCKPLK